MRQELTKSDLAILLTYTLRDKPYNDAELLVVNEAAKRAGVRMPDNFTGQIERILGL